MPAASRRRSSLFNEVLGQPRVLLSVFRTPLVPLYSAVYRAVDTRMPLHAGVYVGRNVANDAVYLISSIIQSVLTNCSYCHRDQLPASKICLV